MELGEDELMMTGLAMAARTTRIHCRDVLSRASSTFDARRNATNVPVSWG